MPSKRQLEQFKNDVWNYYRENRRDFLWRRNINPYRVLVSEIMLQQTQVSRGEVKYREFLQKFPTFKKLAEASSADVLATWQGLGYNRRALYLKKAAEAVTQQYNGKLPDDPALLVKLPGIGPYTAGAVCAFAFNKPVVLIDTNVRRVYIHYFFNDRTDVHDAELVPIIEATVPKDDAREWYSALMDYGSMLGLKEENANKRSAHYVKQSTFEGSLRQARGKLLKVLVQRNTISKKDLGLLLEETPERIDAALAGLERDGMVRVRRNTVSIVI